MFSRFNLTTSNQFEEYRSIGESIYNDNKANIEKSLNDYFDSNGSINGTRLQESWFPEIEADIFLSHSHKDEAIAKGLAGWLLNEFGLKVFIDSCVWGYSLELQKEIDYNFCRIDGKESTYDYEKVMYSTSHVHMMLSTSLSQMMDKTESVFFLNTPNSLNTQDTIDNTESPWIYHELAMTKLVRKNKLSQYRHVLIKEAAQEYRQDNALNIKYDVHLDHMTDLNQNDLFIWAGKYSMSTNRTYPLDVLYKNKGLIKDGN